jgi:diaminohydroxyphosphoribosylaminopyrimidine deaminase / 5-amino-6-(5-phosphoribosylamino)uracil reductase
MTEPGTADRQWLELAIELSRLSPASSGAYSVGAVIVGGDGGELARGYSREVDSCVHAEESALGKLPGGRQGLLAATIYSTLEPCSQRRSRPRSCTELILAAGIGRVVIAWREPGLFVPDCQGVRLLTDAGIAVTEMAELGQRARAVNAHLWSGR